MEEKKINPDDHVTTVDLEGGIRITVIGMYAKNVMVK